MLHVSYNSIHEHNYDLLFISVKKLWRAVCRKEMASVGSTLLLRRELYSPHNGSMSTAPYFRINSSLFPYFLVKSLAVSELTSCGTLLGKLKTSQAIQPNVLSWHLMYQNLKGRFYSPSCCCFKLQDRGDLNFKPQHFYVRWTCHFPWLPFQKVCVDNTPFSFSDPRDPFLDQKFTPT